MIFRANVLALLMHPLELLLARPPRVSEADATRFPSLCQSGATEEQPRAGAFRSSNGCVERSDGLCVWSLVGLYEPQTMHM